jgi:peptidoglycan DL-endopeptidase CwlO
VATSHPALSTPRPTASPSVFGVRAAARHARPATYPRALGVAGLAAITTVALLPAGAANADPRARDVEQRVQHLDVAVSTAVEEFRQAEAQVEEVERRATAAREQAAVEQARLGEAREQMSDVVAAAYRRGGNDRFMALVADGGPQAFLDRAAALDRIAASQAEVLAQVETARSRAEAQQVRAERELEDLRSARQQLEQRKAQVERTLQAQRTLLDGLREQERRRVEAARAAAEAAAVPAPAAAAAPAPAPARASRSGRTAPAPTAPQASAPQAAASQAAAAPAQTYNGPASGRAKAAIDEAHRHLGKPYRYGASGPDSFDCSGFTSYVWRAAGVSLPRTSRDQYAQGRKVSRADIQPGDLVYFGSPIHHVGMYVGDGQMINSPASGGHVRIQPAFRSDFVGATRP